MHKGLGSYYNQSTNEVSFNVYSKNASHVYIYFYASPMGSDEVLSKSLTREGDLWNIKIPLEDLKHAGLTSGYIYYGYRAWGSNWEYRGDWHKGSDAGFLYDVDSQGNRFNPNKLLIDPYAKELSHDPQVAKIYIDPNVYINDYYGGENRSVDTGRIAPKSVLILHEDRTDFGVKPKRLLKDDVIYEVNIRGLTMSDESIPSYERGTYKGAARKARYLKELGVTAIEFLPIQEFADEQNDDGDIRGDNYWGYMTVNYFAPNRRYSSDKSPGGPTREFKEMMKAFHDEGIKVFLDVVYNHTGEGIVRRIINKGNPETQEDIEKAIREANPTRSDDELQDFNAACYLSYTGLDNRSYYYLRDWNRRYEGRGGCGGNLNYNHEVVRNLIIDSLKYWAHEMGVDGFRFDLAPVLSMTGADGVYWPDVNTSIFNDISNTLPSRSSNFDQGVDLIAEPWGEGSDIDWLDKFPGSWAVWNKAFRDTLKTSMNKYGVSPLKRGEISKVLSGSKEYIKKQPWNSINYFVSHDDCNSLRNIFSYNGFFHLNEAVIKYDQITWDHGEDRELQMKAVRNAFSLMMLSAGVPMFTGGDELFRAIVPYAKGIGRMNMVTVDSAEVYIDFKKYNEMKNYMDVGNAGAASGLIEWDDGLYTYEFVKNLIGFRNKHECLRPYNYFSGEINPQNGLKDIAWYSEYGSEINGIQWDEEEFIAYRINARFENVEKSEDKVESIYVAYNRSPRDRYIVFPGNIDSKKWFRVLDTDNTYGWMTKKRNFDGGSTLLGIDYTMHERSVLVVVEK